MGINRVVVSGNLTRDPELRATRSGTAVLSFGVAVDARRRDPQTGEWGDSPCYVDCVMFGRRAEAISGLLAKGAKVCLEGRLRYGSWEAADGSRRSKLDVVVDEIELMPSRGIGGAGAEAASGVYDADAEFAAIPTVWTPSMCDGEGRR